MRSCFCSFSLKIASHCRSASVLDKPEACRLLMVSPLSSPVFRLSCLALKRWPVIVDRAASSSSRGAITSSISSICLDIAKASSPSSFCCLRRKLNTFTLSADTVWLVATSRNSLCPSVNSCFLRYSASSAGFSAAASFNNCLRGSTDCTNSPMFCTPSAPNDDTLPAGTVRLIA